MNTFDDQRLSSLLDFTDEPVALDLGAIVRAGRRRRHQKRTMIAGASAVTLAAAGGLTAKAVADSPGDEHSAFVKSPLDSATATPAPHRLLPATVTQSDNLISDYPPAHGSTTTIVTNANGWRAVAYVDTSGDLCFGSVDSSGASRGACAPTDAFGNGPLADVASGPGLSPAATAPASEAPSAHEIGVFGMVTTAETEPSNIQHVARVTLEAGDSSIDATLSPNAAAMGSTTTLAGDERVWFAWLPSDVPDGAFRVSTYTASGASTGSQPLWLTPHEFTGSGANG